MDKPVHEHDCDGCTYIASYPLRYPRFDDDGFLTGTPGTHVIMGDIYRTCDPDPFYHFIVRFGRMGEYATTNTPSTYVLAPWIDGVDRYANLSFLDSLRDDEEFAPLTEDVFDD